MARYIPTIGLEIHIELKTKTKMFCGCLNDSQERHPNVNVCPICLAHPGVLPVINQEAVGAVLKLGFALNAAIAQVSKFDRKNYFYPDLPKGYQISQYDQPLVSGGYLEIYLAEKNNINDLPRTKKIKLRRVHLEEDAGRLNHSDDGKNTYVDFNRAGVPLAELVTEPDIASALEARRFAEELRAILRYLDIANADMENGEMRCEVNISLAEEGSRELGTKVEIKNLNSFRAVEQSIEYEIKRQTEILEGGGKINHETRGWDEPKGVTVSQRSKEEAHDYRYFPEPDLLPLSLADLFQLEKLKAAVPELPFDKRLRFMKEFGLKFGEVDSLVWDPKAAAHFEEVVSELDVFKTNSAQNRERNIKLAYNYFNNNLRGIMEAEEVDFDHLKISSRGFANLIIFRAGGAISSTATSAVLEEAVTTGVDPESIIKEKNLFQLSDTKDLSAAIEKIIAANPEVVENYKRGKESVLQFLVGQVMKETGGRANPEVVLGQIKAILTK